MASWPKYMTAFTLPFNYDGVTSATPLMQLKAGRVLMEVNYMKLFLGSRGGCIGEVCILALVLGQSFF